MAQVVDSFVVPVPRKNLNKYLTLAKLMGKIWTSHGALEYIECVGENIKPGKITSFPKSVKLKSGETVVLSWIKFKSKSHREAVNKRAFKDPRFQKIMKEKMPFDGKRMFFGTFNTILIAKS